MEHCKNNQASYTSHIGCMYTEFHGVFQHTTIGAVTELCSTQYLVSMTPAVTREFVQNGHTVYFQTGFATRAGFTDEQYKQAGAKPLTTAEEVYKQCHIILKVNPLQQSEFIYIQPQQVIFCQIVGSCPQQQQFLQAAAKQQATIVSYNMLLNCSNTSSSSAFCFPVHNALCEVAGYLGVQQAMKQMEVSSNGLLFGQVAGVPGANVLILGTGPCATRAASLAVATGASVTVMDANTDALRNIAEGLKGVHTLHYTQTNLELLLPKVNTLIGCVIPICGKAPVLVSDTQLQLLPEGSIAIDLAAGFGGNFQATTPQTIQKPTYTWNGITMYTATNINCLAPQTASTAFSQAALPYVLQVANKGWKKAVIEFAGLQEGVCVAQGCVTSGLLAFSMKFKYTPIEQVLESEIQKIGSNQQQTNIVSLKQQLNTFRTQQGPCFTIEA